MGDEWRFDTEYNSDEELDAALDALVGIVEAQVKTDESRTSMVSLDRARAVVATYKVMQRLVKGSGAKVTYKLNKPFKSMGSVSVCGKDFTFANHKWIAEIIQLADNFEVYPRTDGTVCATFTFHGLTIPLE